MIPHARKELRCLRFNSVLRDVIVGPMYSRLPRRVAGTFSQRIRHFLRGISISFDRGRHLLLFVRCVCCCGTKKVTRADNSDKNELIRDVSYIQRQGNRGTSNQEMLRGGVMAVMQAAAA